MNKAKNIAILGAGESGVGAAILGVKMGLNVFVSDLNSEKDSYAKNLEDAKIEWESGKHSEDKILSADLIVKSPGIPPSADIILKAKDTTHKEKE